MMKNFISYLEKTGEVGYVDKTLKTVVYVDGLPKAKPKEVVLFETGEIGEVLSLTRDYVEVLLLTEGKVGIGTKVARTGKLLEVPVGEDLLGKTINALGEVLVGKSIDKGKLQVRAIDTIPAGIDKRKYINKPLETGVSVIDLLVPLGKGQRELIVGDRKTGKTQILMQILLTQALQGTVCVYAAIAKKRLDIKILEEYVKKHKIDKNVVIVSSSSSDPPGLVYITPYSAMTIAEYFRDCGRDVLILMDDLSAHAKYYREISLLARRFPGRSSYPGDIFYLHSRLMERAGNFKVSCRGKDKKTAEKEVSITCLSIAELVLGDISGYIQTNLMSMTDGHIFFDSNFYNQGRRPAINTFLSVTRVGRQAQTSLLRDINRQVTSFLVNLERLKEFMRFGAELSESIKRTLSLGDRIVAFFDQPFNVIIPVNIGVLLLASLWAGYWNQQAVNMMKKDMLAIVETYNKNEVFRKKVDAVIDSTGSLDDLVVAVKKDNTLLLMH